MWKDPSNIDTGHMQIADILTPARVESNVNLADKKCVLELLARLIAQDSPDLTPEEVFDSLCARERLGSTGLGHGVAIPHGRLQGGKQTMGAFVHLAEGVDYDAVDQQPVDLLFALLVPENSTDKHLQMLARIAEMFSNSDLVSQLRNGGSATVLYQLLTE